ncbi:MAG: thiosulfate oxidation carrier complex protein SoxZ [Betaproteobacteria bacterium]|nr:thiosulfate oxidation carrier complex protein SoxZ [Betaproteobacteria bacterium]
MLARIQVSSPVRRGQSMAVRLLLQHPMETGFRYDFSGTSIAKNVIHTLSAEYAGHTVFRARMGSGVAANPLLQFWVLPTQSGDLRVQWQDDLGVRGEVSTWVEVLPT